MLEGLCISLYDVLRPLIIHINHLETLAELCSILKIEMLQDHVQNNRKYFIRKYLNLYEDGGNFPIANNTGTQMVTSTKLVLLF